MSLKDIGLKDALQDTERMRRALSVFVELDDWERDILLTHYFSFDVACFEAAKKQTTIPRAIKWLQLGAEEGHIYATLIYASLLQGVYPGLQYKGDEAAYWLKQGEQIDIISSGYFKLNIFSFDPNGSRARRFLTRLLLSGSLSKNQDSVLSRSFFRSGLREVHLLPLILKFLPKEEIDGSRLLIFERETIDFNRLTVLPLIIFQGTSYTKSLTLSLEADNQYICYLSIFFSRCPNLKMLKFNSHVHPTPSVDLSYLQQADTSKLESLVLSRVRYQSLSSLSLCNFSSFHTLCISNYHISHLDGLHPLNGLSSDISRSLKTLQVNHSDIKDLSPLSDCDLSSLEELLLYNNRSLSDLSALRGSDLSSLKYLNLQCTSVSDLSPLCECKGLALEKITLSCASIIDLSSLSLLDLSCLKACIYLDYTKVSDLSPLENISYEGVEVYIPSTPAANKMKEEGLKSPQTIGKVTVKWD